MIRKILNCFGYYTRPQLTHQGNCKICGKVVEGEFLNTDEIICEKCNDRILLNKANSLVGQEAQINGICGDVERVTLTDVVGITNEMGYKEVRFSTDDDFYSTVIFKPETVMNWKYNKS